MFKSIFTATVKKRKSNFYEQTIELLIKQKGLIKDSYHKEGLLQLTHVGLFTTKDGESELVGLIDGVVFSINRIDIHVTNGVVDSVSLSVSAIGGTVHNVSLSMGDRCEFYNNDPGSPGSFTQIIPVKG